MKNFALIGNPNCGKTTLFNTLTGSTARVGNWPGVTVDKREGVYKKLNEAVNIIDLPGIYSLSPYTPEEVVSRNCIMSGDVDVVIDVVDATNIERNLYLTTQLMEIDVPIIIALNMMDVAKKNGDIIDSKLLSERLGVPVIEISALRSEGMDELMDSAYKTSNTKRLGQTVLKETSVAHVIDDVFIALSSKKVKNPLFHAVKLTEGDELEVKMHPEEVAMVEAFKDQMKDDIYDKDIEANIADQRYKYITKYYATAVKKKFSPDQLTKSDKIDKIVTHRILGIPIFLLIMFAVFHFTFSEDLFFIQAISGGRFAIDWFGGEGTGIPSIGVFLQVCVEYVSELITGGVGNLLQGASPWVTSLICDGILAGVFSVLSFLPQILLLFLFLSLLEDSGYMARAAFMMDKIFKKVGLSGRSFMPLLMGFGCSVPAIMTTKNLEDEGEKNRTIKLIPFFSCGAKLPIYTVIAGALFANNSDLIIFGMYAVGVIVAVVCAIILKKIEKESITAPFMMELPTYHIPQFKNTMLHLWDKMKHFIQKAATIIAASTVVIWFLSHFSWGWQFLSDEQIGESIIASLGKFLNVFAYPLGFGGEYGWAFVVAIITGLIAKENVVATLAVLGTAILSGAGIATGGEDGAVILQLINLSGITTAGILSFMVFNLLCIPCMAAVAATKGELGKGKNYKLTLLFWMVTAYIVSFIINIVGSYWWTSFIIIAVVALLIVVLTLLEKKRNAKSLLKAK